MACFGFFIQYAASAWCGSAPIGARLGNVEGDVDLFSLTALVETVFEQSFESGLSVRISRDGLVLLKLINVPGYIEDVTQVKKSNSIPQDSATAQVKFRAPYVEAMNAFIACLGGSLPKRQYPLNLGHVATNRMQEAKNDFSLGVTRSFVTGNHINARFAHGYHFPPHGDSRNIRSNVITVDILKKSAENLNSLVVDESRMAIKLAAMFTLAVASYEEHDFSRSLITSWAVIETILNVLWKKLMLENNPPIQGKRKDKWNGNSFTASIKIEMLSMSGQLSEEEYKLVDAARLARNSWIHALDDVTYNSAARSIYVASILFQRIFKIPLAKNVVAWL